MEGLVGRNDIVRRHGFPSCFGQGGRDRFVVFLWRRVLPFVLSRFAFFKYSGGKDKTKKEVILKVLILKTIL